MKYRLYRFTRPIIKGIMKCFFFIEIKGSDNLPLDGSFILAGNHQNNLDCFLLMSSTKRTIRFMAKKELLDKCHFIFSRMGIIPVDRKRRNKEALEEALEVLKNKGVIGIFPEGTHNKTEYVVMPFKMGAVKMASESNSYIVPFAIIGEYKFLRRSIKLVFDKPYKIKNKKDLKAENIILMNKVIKLMKENENEKR